MANVEVKVDLGCELQRFFSLPKPHPAITAEDRIKPEDYSAQYAADMDRQREDAFQSDAAAQDSRIPVFDISLPNPTIESIDLKDLPERSSIPDIKSAVDFASEVAAMNLSSAALSSSDIAASFFDVSGVISGSSITQ